MVEGSTTVEGCWTPKRSADAIPQRQVLAVVVRVKQMMIGVMSSSVDQRLQHRGHTEIPVVNRHRPDVDEHVQAEIQQLVHWEEEHVHVVRNALQEAVDGMERMTGVWSRNFPSVVRFVDRRVDKTMVKSAMNPVDQTVGKQDEEERGEQHSQPSYIAISNRISTEIR